MGFAEMFDSNRNDDVRQLRREVADIAHNLKRVMEHLGIDYERNPLLEISPAVLEALQQGQDGLAVETVANDRNLTTDQATAFLEVIKPRLGLGELSC